MSGTVLLELQGVLRNESSGPITEGLVLYHALATVHRLVLVCDDVADEHWLKSNGLQTHSQLLVGEMDLAVRRARGTLGMNVAMVVTPSPAIAAASMHLGVTTLLFAHPKFARPEFRADIERQPKEWDAIVAEVEAQQHAKVRVPQYEDDSV